MRRSPIRSRSAKAARIARERRKLADSFADHTGFVGCAYPGCYKRADDLDEIVLRSQRSGGELDPTNVQPLCREHHDWKHQHPNEAERLGLYVRGSTYRQESS